MIVTIDVPVTIACVQPSTLNTGGTIPVEARTGVEPAEGTRAKDLVNRSPPAPLPLYSTPRYFYLHHVK